MTIYLLQKVFCHLKMPFYLLQKVFWHLKMTLYLLRKVVGHLTCRAPLPQKVPSQPAKTRRRLRVPLTLPRTAPFQGASAKTSVVQRGRQLFEQLGPRRRLEDRCDD